MARKKVIDPHPHSECVKAKLIQYAQDPIIAQCGVDGERHVASTSITCPYFKQRTDTPEIEHRKKRIGITDIYYD